MHRTIESKSFLWNFFGTISSTLISVVLLLVASRFLTTSEADLFSYSFTVAQQLFVIGLFGVRQYQSTDVLEKHHFGDYFWSRAISVLFMFMAMSVWILLTDLNSNYILPIFLLTIFRSVDAVSDVFQGFFQQKQRSDLAGKALFYHSTFSIISFTIGLFITKSLNHSLFVMLLVNLVILLVSDVRLFREQFNGMSKYNSFAISVKQTVSVLSNCFPIFINTFLINYIYSEPRFAITAVYSNQINFEGTQRDFNIIFMPFFVLNLLMLILRPMLTSISISWNNGDVVSYRRQIKRISFSLLGLHILIMLLGFLLGLPVLGLIYGVDLSKYQIAFMILLLAGGFNVFSVLIDNLLTIRRKQSLLLISTVTSFIISQLLTEKLVTTDGINGASLSLLACMVTYFVMSLLVLLFNNRKKRILPI